MSPYINHYPVMRDEIIAHVVKNKDGFYIDCTFGSGGHSKEILAKLSPKGRLIALDVDEDAYQIGKAIEKKDSRFRIFKENFADLEKLLKKEGYPKADGLIFDLGASTNQLKNPDKGFSYSTTSSVLDMRMDNNLKLSARDVLSTYSRDQLNHIFKKYGEISNPSKLVYNISIYRKHNREITTSGEFIDIIKNSFYDHREGGTSKKMIRKCFQAIRIEVNRELENLEKVLNQLADIVSPGGFVGFITFHSLEEKKIREWKAKNCDPIVIEDYGYDPINKFIFVKDGYVTASNLEIEENMASRSAKMWVAKKHH